MTTVEQLRQAGFVAAADALDAATERRRRLSVAYNTYAWVRTEHVQALNAALYERMVKRMGRKGRDLVERYDRLRFTPLERYAKVPPAAALEAVIAARGLGCFDRFEVCDVESVVEEKDPIVFGRIEGCTDRFVIAQWDDDVTVEQLLAAAPTDA